MADYLTPKRPNKLLPVTRDCDRPFSVCRKNTDGDPVDWDAEVYMLIDISKGEPATRIDADVVGEIAAINVESEIANLCKTGTTWRVVRSAGERQLPLLVGTFERNDGK